MLLNPYYVFHSYWQFEQEFASRFRAVSELCTPIAKNIIISPRPIADGCRKYILRFCRCHCWPKWTLKFFYNKFLPFYNIKLSFLLSHILSYPEVTIAVSTFNETIECAFVFYKNYMSIMHRFRYNQVFLARNDAMSLSPLGALQVIYNDGFG